MLGAELGQENGRIIGQRVLDAEGPKIEARSLLKEYIEP